LAQQRCCVEMCCAQRGKYSWNRCQLGEQRLERSMEFLVDLQEPKADAIQAVVDDLCFCGSEKTPGLNQPDFSPQPFGYSQYARHQRGATPRERPDRPPDL